MLCQQRLCVPKVKYRLLVVSEQHHHHYPYYPTNVGILRPTSVASAIMVRSASVRTHHFHSMAQHRQSVNRNRAHLQINAPITSAYTSAISSHVPALKRPPPTHYLGSCVPYNTDSCRRRVPAFLGRDEKKFVNELLDVLHNRLHLTTQYFLGHILIWPAGRVILFDISS